MATVRLPVDRQYRGTQNSEVISKPAPFSRKMNKDQEAGGDAIFAKDPEERRVDPRDGQLKLAVAGVAAVQSDLEKEAIVKAVTGAAGRVADAGKRAIRRAKAVPRARRAKAEGRSILGGGRPAGTTVPAKPVTSSSPGVTPMRMDVGGEKVLLDRRTGQRLIDEGGGKFRPMGTHKDPGVAALEAAEAQRQAGSLGFMDQHRIMTQMRGPDGKPLRADTMGSRFRARSLDFLQQNPMAGMMLPMMAQPVMSMIPAGRDEWGNRKSLADTTAGQLALGIGAPLAGMALPGMAARRGAGTPGRLGSLPGMMASTVGPKPGGLHVDPGIINTPPPTGVRPTGLAVGTAGAAAMKPNPNTTSPASPKIPDPNL